MALTSCTKLLVGAIIGIVKWISGMFTMPQQFNSITQTQKKYKLHCYILLKLKHFNNVPQANHETTLHLPKHNICSLLWLCIPSNTLSQCTMTRLPFRQPVRFVSECWKHFRCFLFCCYFLRLLLSDPVQLRQLLVLLLLEGDDLSAT